MFILLEILKIPKPTAFQRGRDPERPCGPGTVNGFLSESPSWPSGFPGDRVWEREGCGAHGQCLPWARRARRVLRLSQP